MVMKKVNCLFYTLKYLKPVQIYWKFVIKLNSLNLRLISRRKKYKFVDLPILFFEKNVYNKKTNNILIFNKKFNLSKINWQEKEIPKLWNYHLHYFDFISHCDKETGLAIIHNWINSNPPGKSICWEPYPISLRIINWIKFLSRNSISDKNIFGCLFIQGMWLFKQREYHLLTNHLFKNVVALLYLGILFEIKKWKDWALKELKRQIEEQVTDEGYHFEFSPTYHALFVKDLLDIYNLIKNNTKGFYVDLLEELSEKIQKGLHWLDCFNEGEKYMPINDVNYEGCPKPLHLKKYASNLGIEEEITTDYKISQYYPKLESGDLKIMMYCAPINPDYNPAHSHADMLSILLWDNHNPILVDTGNYDYEESEERKYARSTFAHNTIVIDNENQCDLWKVFRIGRRGQPFNKKITENFLQCSHDCYNKLGVIHKRTINKKDNGFLIQDFLFGKGYHIFEMYFHFASELVKTKKKNTLIINNEIKFDFPCDEISIITTPYFPKMYVKENKQTIKICGEFEGNKTLITTIMKSK